MKWIILFSLLNLLVPTLFIAVHALPYTSLDDCSLNNEQVNPIAPRAAQGLSAGLERPSQNRPASTVPESATLLLIGSGVALVVICLVTKKRTTR